MLSQLEIEVTKESDIQRSPIRITITGHAVAYARSGMTIRNGKPRAFQPKKQRNWQGDARQVARIAMGTKKPLNGCLHVQVNVYAAIPSSWPDWKREAALGQRIRPTGKPDASNLVKIVEDAFNGVVWMDDAQIVQLSVDKAYSDVPRVQVDVWPLASYPHSITRKADLR